jgi:hypothetical protein
LISFRKKYSTASVITICSDPKKLDTKTALLILTLVQADWPTSPLRIRQA